MNRHESRGLAKRYVGQLIERGYREQDAKEEISMGMGGPNEPGYEISHGKITVPMLNGHTFNFTDLSQELRRGEQMELF